MHLYALVLLAVSYVAFVFISDLFNPFVSVKAPLKRRRWRLGRAAAVSSLFAGALAILLLNINALDEHTALAAYLLLTSIFVTPAIVKYKKTAIWQ